MTEGVEISIRDEQMPFIPCRMKHEVKHFGKLWLGWVLELYESVRGHSQMTFALRGEGGGLIQKKM